MVRSDQLHHHAAQATRMSNGRAGAGQPASRPPEAGVCLVGSMLTSASFHCVFTGWLSAACSLSVSTETGMVLQAARPRRQGTVARCEQIQQVASSTAQLHGSFQRHRLSTRNSLHLQA